MEIAVISNICANKHALDAFLKYINENHQVQTIINCGNFLEIGPNPHEVVKKIMSDNRFINILSQKDLKILSRVPSVGAHLSYFSYYDWALYEIGLNLAKKLKELPVEHYFKFKSKTILARYSFPHDISTRPDYIVIEEHPKSFIGEFHGIKVISPGILGYSKEGKINFALIDTENDKTELCSIQYNNANLFSDYKKSRIPEKKELIRTYHK